MMRLGWTWQQFEDTPQEVISKAVILLNAEAEVQRMKMHEAH